MFLEAFRFDIPASVNFVGGGGKTCLILELLSEFHRAGAAVYTTTVKIHPPDPPGNLLLVGSRNEPLLAEMIEAVSRDWGARHCRIVATAGEIGPRLLGGVAPDFSKRLSKDLCPLILNEADGARSMSLKLPREGEPVLMLDAEYLVPVIGLDVIGQSLGPETVFRWGARSSKFGLLPGGAITPAVAAGILLHPRGVCRDWRPGMRIVPFINKADDSGDDGPARELASALFHSKSFPVDTIVWGSVERRRVFRLEKGRA